jgi:YD repeat-containing protein
VSGQTYTLGYDAEGHLVSVTGPSMSAAFVYDGDGARVKHRGLEPRVLGAFCENGGE